MQRVLMILGTGGTIAGTATTAIDHTGYLAGQRSVADLLAGVPLPRGFVAESEQVAQIDSKDMDHETWARLAQRIESHLARDEVAAVVVTHGTDTLEETAWFLHRVLAPAKPVVLTAAMRPATALSADGPQNLADALTVAVERDARGVVVVLAGRVHAAGGLRKLHPYRVDAFADAQGGPIATVEDSRVRSFRPWPETESRTARLPALPATGWPWVEVVTSHAGARPDAIRALVAAGASGIVVAGTGNGTVHAALEPALADAEAAGVVVWRCTRCPLGALVGAGPGPAAGLSPWAARIELMFSLLGGD